jgi:CheY-like chemotaxis protein
MLFTALKNSVQLAQVDETRAPVMLTEGRIVDAERTTQKAVQVLERGDEQSLLAEALTADGIALVRLHHHEQARLTLERAIDVAEKADDLQSASLAALTLVEQLGQHLSNDELCVTVKRAAVLLEETRDMASVWRLAKVACRSLYLVHAYPAQPDWPTFYVREVMHRYEGHFLELALKDSGGSVTGAARLLGLPGHQSLLAMLARHKDLYKLRKPIKPRRRSIIRRRDAASSLRKKASRKARTVNVLHVEDNEMVAKTIKDLLAPRGWKVETCADGAAALKKIASRSRYDLLLLESDLPSLSGIQLIQLARNLAHRRRTPIVILSATLDEAAARQAGADAFLRKPEDIMAVGETIARLLQSAKN